MEYKRLTIKNSDGTYSQPTDLTFEKAFYRLAELEDKLEQGKMIELPCVIQNCYGDWRVHFYSEKYKDIDCYTFCTKAEAEAKLKELQNER